MQNKNFFINMAFELAKINLGSTKNNPSVGCIVEKNDTVLSSGHTSLNGRPHAEFNALNKKLDFKNSNLYVTLEPCSHFGRTPPCTNIIKKKKVKAVFFSLTDQDTRSKNKSKNKLKVQKIIVKKNVLRNKGLEFYKSYFMQHNNLEPYIDAKIAISRDFFTKNSKKGFITNEFSRQRGNFLRSMYDCIISTSKTINSDNALMNCRIKGLEAKSPDLIIIDRQLKLKRNLKFFSKKIDRRVFLFTSNKYEKKLSFFKKKGIKVRFIESLKSKKDFNFLFSKLKKMGYNRIFIEAGFTFLDLMLKYDYVNNLYLFKSSLELKKFGQNLATHKIIKNIKIKDRIKVNLDGDNLYKIKIKN
tara:strand:- start:223 stop:1296 length:1074 start_codon:yes stop_codon:yes gene_type:complete